MSLSPLRFLQVTAAYTVLTILLTWPLATEISSHVAEDVGDPLLNTWILAWSGGRLGRLLMGDLSALHGYWNANIFYPEVGTLAYSEHLTAQALLSLPVRVVTTDPITIYNFALLFTFVLSALGAFLLARELTRSDSAAFFAGLVFGFAPYRFHHFTHLQILSAQWMPLALLALRRHVVTRRGAWLAAAVVALLLNNLSCGYYIFYFAPFVVLFVLHESARRGLLGDVRLWACLVVAAVALLLLTLPFLLPYLRVQQAGVLVRGLNEVESYSADAFSFLTAPETNRLWGGVLRAAPGPEKELFPSFTALVLAAVGALTAIRRRRAGETAGVGKARVASERTISRALVALWNRTWGLLARIFVSHRGFLLLALGLAWWLSLGPTIRSLGRPASDFGLYGLFYEHIPGFDGLRVPARFGTVALLFLSLLGAFGARRIRQLPGGRGAVAAICGLFLLEATSAPLPLASPYQERRLDLHAGPSVGTPPIYGLVARLPAEAVIAELPFGRYPYEQVYMLHSTTHWRPLLNGASGVYPASYERRRSVLGDVLTHRERAWRVLLESGATHVLVHEGLWGLPRRGHRVTVWLEANGATLVARVGRDALLELPSPVSSGGAGAM